MAFFGLSEWNTCLVYLCWLTEMNILAYLWFTCSGLLWWLFWAYLSGITFAGLMRWLFWLTCGLPLLGYFDGVFERAWVKCLPGLSLLAYWDGFSLAYLSEFPVWLTLVAFLGLPEWNTYQAYQYCLALMACSSALSVWITCLVLAYYGDILWLTCVKYLSGVPILAYFDGLFLSPPCVNYSYLCGLMMWLILSIFPLPLSLTDDYTLITIITISRVIFFTVYYADVFGFSLSVF